MHHNNIVSYHVPLISFVCCPRNNPLSFDPLTLTLNGVPQNISMNHFNERFDDRCNSKGPDDRHGKTNRKQRQSSSRPDEGG